MLLKPQWVGCSLKVVNTLFSCDVYSDGEFVVQFPSVVDEKQV